MLTPEQLSALLISIFAIGYTPGPANIYVMSCALNYGTRPAFRVWCGMFCGASCAAIVAAFAAHIVGIAFGEYVRYIKYVAVIYILYLAWKTYRSSIAEGVETAPSFASGFVVQMTNAKIILFDLSSYAMFVLPYSERFVDLLPVAALLLLAGPGANLVWLLVGSAIRPFIQRYQRMVSVVMALALVGCAIFLLVK